MVKTVVGGLIGAFLIFYVMTSPDQAAAITQNIWNLVVNLAHGIGDFVNKLAS